MKYVFSILSVLLFFACNPQKEFNEAEWKNVRKDGITWIPESRYPMTLWLKDNYQFCGKTQMEIIEKFGDEGAYMYNNDSLPSGITEMQYVIKQKDTNFIIGIDPPCDLAYLTVCFEEGIVVKAMIEEREDKGDFFTKIIICQ